MPRRSLDQQSKRFIEAARELGAEVPEEEFDRALRRVGRAPPSDPKPKPKKPTKPRR
jgi:hypothetical protein